jgi:hypothetical protein
MELAGDRFGRRIRGNNFRSCKAQGQINQRISMRFSTANVIEASPHRCTFAKVMSSFSIVYDGTIEHDDYLSLRRREADRDAMQKKLMAAKLAKQRRKAAGLCATSAKHGEATYGTLCATCRLNARCALARKTESETKND